MLLFTVIGAAFGAASLAGIVQIGGAGMELLQWFVGAILGGTIGYRLSI